MELIDNITQQLGLSGGQAEGAAGLLFKLARDRLGADDFSNLSAAVPGIGNLLKAAPEAGGMTGLLGKALGGKAGDLASLAGGFSKLGVDLSTVQQIVPIVLAYVQKQGGAGIADLLSNILKP